MSTGQWTFLVPLLVVLLLSVVLHEWAHARVAVAQGDPTPLRAGRLTLNPVPHLDLFGSIVVPVLLWLAPGGIIFGWAKPVPVDPDNYRRPRRGDVLVSLAGVAANVVLAAAFVAAWAAAARVEAAVGGGPGELLPALRRTASFGVLLNLVLAVFNLLPIPPLDGSHVMYHLLPDGLGDRYRELGRYSVILLLAVFLFPEILGIVFEPVRLLHAWSMELARLLAG